MGAPNRAHGGSNVDLGTAESEHNGRVLGGFKGVSQRLKSEELRCVARVYYIRIDVNEGVVYKIGITNLTVRERYPYASDQARIKIVKEWWFEVGADAAAHEQKLLQEYRDFQYSGPPVLSGVGVTEVFACDVLGLDGGKRPGPAQLSLFG